MNRTTTTGPILPIQISNIRHLFDSAELDKDQERRILRVYTDKDRISDLTEGEARIIITSALTKSPTELKEWADDLAVPLKERLKARG